jgi:hypothetical protein
MSHHAWQLQHGRLFSLRLRDGAALPLMAWRSATGDVWQLVDGCPGGDLCLHGRHAHMSVMPDGRFEVDEGTEPSPHDLDVRAVAEGLTVDHLQPANRLAIALFRVISGPRFPCSRCVVVLGEQHHPECHLNNLVPLFPMLDGEALRNERS